MDTPAGEDVIEMDTVPPDPGVSMRTQESGTSETLMRPALSTATPTPPGNGYEPCPAMVVMVVIMPEETFRKTRFEVSRT